jgi:hypothetical protein
MIKQIKNYARYSHFAFVELFYNSPYIQNNEAYFVLFDLGFDQE